MAAELLPLAIGEHTPTLNGIPLIGVDQLSLKDANAAALISVLADIIEATCVVPAVVFTPHTLRCEVE